MTVKYECVWLGKVCTTTKSGQTLRSNRIRVIILNRPGKELKFLSTFHLVLYKINRKVVLYINYGFPTRFKREEGIYRRNL